MEGSKVMKTRAYGLSKNTTVFQAKLHAIKMAAGTIRDVFTCNQGAHINIMCDSQSAVRALGEIETKSKLVKENKLARNAVSATYTISINWIKVHVYNKGN